MGEACLLTASLAPLVAAGQAPGWGGSGGPWTPTCDPLSGCVRARPTDTHVPGCLEGVAGGSVPAPIFWRAERRHVGPWGCGAGKWIGTVYPEGLGPISIQESYLPPCSSSLSHPGPLPAEIPPTGLLCSPPAYLSLLLPLIPLCCFPGQIAPHWFLPLHHPFNYQDV